MALNAPILYFDPAFNVYATEGFANDVEEPKKVCFTYDLFLNLEGNPPVNHLRCEKLTFNNPTKEFRHKLIKAGGFQLRLQLRLGFRALSEPQSRCVAFGRLPLPSKSSLG
ncbi:Protein ENL, partial [Ophiophagus hannah]